MWICIPPFRQLVSQNDSLPIPSIATYTNLPLYILLTPHCFFLDVTPSRSVFEHQRSLCSPAYQRLFETNNCDLAMVNRHAPGTRSCSVTLNDSFPYSDVLLSCEGLKASQIRRSHAAIIIFKVPKSGYECSLEIQNHEVYYHLLQVMHFKMHFANKWLTVHLTDTNVFSWP